MLTNDDLSKIYTEIARFNHAISYITELQSECNSAYNAINNIGLGAYRIMMYNDHLGITYQVPPDIAEEVHDLVKTRLLERYERAHARLLQYVEIAEGNIATVGYTDALLALW